MDNPQYTSSHQDHFYRMKKDKMLPNLSRTDSNVSKKSVSFTSEEPEVVIYSSGFQCGDCGLEFPCSRDRDEHLERCHLREWVKCLICVKTVKHKEHFVI